jgi:hypothetical protein
VSAEVQRDQDAHALQDCDMMDSMPFDAQYESEEEGAAPLFNEDADSDDKGPRVRSSGAI